VYDRRWRDDWGDELPDVTTDTLATFAQAVNLEERISPEFLRVYGPYLGGQFPKFVRAFRTSSTTRLPAVT